jgi:hypothetical protein
VGCAGPGNGPGERQEAVLVRIRAFPWRLIRFESRTLALFNSSCRSAASPRPARLMKYVSIRMPDPGPFGETFFEAKTLAMVLALLVNNPAGG